MSTTTTEKTTIITATVGAYLTDVGCQYRGRAALLASIPDAKRHPQIVGQLLAYSAHDMSKSWARVGDATISVTFASHDEMVASAIQSLRAQIDAARADFMRKQAECLEQINKLQAIEYTSEVA